MIKWLSVILLSFSTVLLLNIPVHATVGSALTHIVATLSPSPEYLVTYIVIFLLSIFATGGEPTSAFVLSVVVMTIVLLFRACTGG